MEACNHPNWQHRRRTKSNGVGVVVKQCLSCGKNMGEVPKMQFEGKLLCDWDERLRQSWKEKWQLEWEERQRQFQVEQLTRTGEWWNKYNEYLRGNHWRNIRGIVLSRDRHCQICFSRPTEQVHHLSYDSFNKWGYSFAVECVGLCEICHDLIHGRDAL